MISSENHTPVKEFNPAIKNKRFTMIKEIISQILRSGDIVTKAQEEINAQLLRERELDAKLKRCAKDFDMRAKNTSNERVLQFRSLRSEIRKVQTQGI